MEPESDKNQRSVNMSKLQPLQCKIIVFRVPGTLKMNKKIDEKTGFLKVCQKTVFFRIWMGPVEDMCLQGSQNDGF